MIDDFSCREERPHIESAGIMGDMYVALLAVDVTLREAQLLVHEQVLDKVVEGTLVDEGGELFSAERIDESLF